MRIRGSREGVYRNNGVQFQSCDSSSYCTALGENVSRQLRDSCGCQISEEGDSEEEMWNADKKHYSLA